MENLIIGLIVLFLGGIAFIVSTFLINVDRIAKKIVASPSWQNEIKNEKLNKLKFSMVGYRLFEQKLVAFINDLNLSSEELHELSEIEKYFNLKQKRTNTIKSRYSNNAIDKLSKLALKDNTISKDERKAMYQLAESLNLPAAAVDKINHTNAIQILKAAKENALSDSRLTAEEENELLELTDKLGLTEDELLGPMPEQKRMTYCKLMWEVENGKLPEIASPIILQKKEICHYAIDVTRLETKTVTTGYAAGSKGVSIRIAKGVSYRVGAYRGHPIKEEVTFRYPGDLVITSKRIVFVASEKGFSIPINKLDNIEAYQDGLGFQKGSTYYLLSMEYPDLVGLIVTEAANRL